MAAGVDRPLRNARPPPLACISLVRRLSKRLMFGQPTRFPVIYRRTLAAANRFRVTLASLSASPNRSMAISHRCCRSPSDRQSPRSAAPPKFAAISDQAVSRPNDRLLGEAAFSGTTSGRRFQRPKRFMTERSIAGEARTATTNVGDHAVAASDDPLQKPRFGDSSCIALFILIGSQRSYIAILVRNSSNDPDSRNPCDGL